MSTRFIYNKEDDQRCLERYRTFITEHGSVWGIHREIKDIITVVDAVFDIDLTEITEIYRPIFNLPQEPIVTGRLVTTPFSMINDDVSFDEVYSTIFYSIYTPNPSVVLAHELFHIYFEKYTKRNIPNYDVSKEYFTVIMNDLFGKEVSGGYPDHREMRERIYKVWQDTHSIDVAIAAIS